MKRYIKADTDNTPLDGFDYKHLSECSSEKEFILQELPDSYIEDFLIEAYNIDGIYGRPLEYVVEYIQNLVYNDLISGEYYLYDEEVQAFKRNKDLIYETVRDFVEEHYEEYEEEYNAIDEWV